jgi:hypothetical protein
MSSGLFSPSPKDAVGLPPSWRRRGFFTPTRLIVHGHGSSRLLRSISEFGRMPRDIAHGPYVCRVLPEREEHQGCEGRLQHQQLFLDRISYPAALLVAVVLGFEGALVALGASEAVTAKHGPPAAIPVEMAKPPQCSIETPDYCDVLPSRRELTAYRALFTRAGSGSLMRVIKQGPPL